MVALPSSSSLVTLDLLVLPSSSSLVILDLLVLLSSSSFKLSSVSSNSSTREMSVVQETFGYEIRNGVRVADQERGL